MQPFSGSVFLLFTAWKSEYLNKQSQPLCPTNFSLCPDVVLGLAFVQQYSKLWKTAAHFEQAFFYPAPFFFSSFPQILTLHCFSQFMLWHIHINSIIKRRVGMTFSAAAQTDARLKWPWNLNQVFRCFLIIYNGLINMSSSIKKKKKDYGWACQRTVSMM